MRWMPRNPKRWIAAGLSTVVLGCGAGGLLLRHRSAQRALQLRAADGPASRDLAASPVSLPTLPETPEMIAQEVATALTAWRQAILGKDADTVVTLDRSFVNAPDRYRAALVDSARKDGDERVRAF